MLSMREVSRVYRTDTVETTALDGIFLDVADGSSSRSWSVGLRQSRLC